MVRHVSIQLLALSIALAACSTGSKNMQPTPPESRGVQEPSPSRSHPAFTFIALDTDGDGYVSRSESVASPELVAEFSNVDESQDDKLNEMEFAKLSAPKQLSIPIPIDFGTGNKHVIDIKAASSPLDAGPNIAP